MTEQTDAAVPDFTKPHYVVRWEIDEWADNPEQAAIQARNLILAGGAVSTIFMVKEYDGIKPRWKEIDIEDLEGSDGASLNTVIRERHTVVADGTKGMERGR